VEDVTLGKRIRGAREELGMSQAQLASCGGLSQGYLSQLENDEVRNPSAAVIFRLARALHLDPRLLMQAAGYTAAEDENGEGFEVSVDPDLMRFLAQMPKGQQEHLLRLLKGMDRRTAVGTGGRR